MVILTAGLRLLPDRDEYKVDTSEFQEVRARLMQLENRRDLTAGDQDRPSLRRNVQPEKSTDESEASGDDRPTLRRRLEDHPQ